ncbi:50S ribosomal protein L32e [Candidatus Woesearchaeota archaeon]|nr:50S ribosomal protein L32e [Candidatus Woesearchaeota archaeon]
MKDFKKMLELRSIIKKKKPVFLRQDFQIKKLKKKWIRAKGIHSKIRQSMAGHISMPNPGFGSPKIVRGLNHNGLREVLVHNVNDLLNVKEGCCAVIGKTVGMKKRLDIAKKAVELKINISNVENPNEFVKNAEDSIKKKKENTKKGKPDKKIAEKKTEEKKQTKEEEKELKKKVLEMKAK